MCNNSRQQWTNFCLRSSWQCSRILNWIEIREIRRRGKARVQMLREMVGWSEFSGLSQTLRVEYESWVLPTSPHQASLHQIGTLTCNAFPIVSEQRNAKSLEKGYPLVDSNAKIDPCSVELSRNLRLCLPLVSLEMFLAVDLQLAWINIFLQSQHFSRFSPS
jgi:hypothetical protein